MNEKEEKRAFGIIEMMLTSILTLQGYSLWWMNNLDNRITIQESNSVGDQINFRIGTIEHRHAEDLKELRVERQIDRKEILAELREIRKYVERGTK